MRRKGAPVNSLSGFVKKAVKVRGGASAQPLTKSQRLEMRRRVAAVGARGTNNLNAAGGTESSQEPAKGNGDERATPPPSAPQDSPGMPEAVNQAQQSQEPPQAATRAVASSSDGLKSSLLQNDGQLASDMALIQRFWARVDPKAQEAITLRVVARALKTTDGRFLLRAARWLSDLALSEENLAIRRAQLEIQRAKAKLDLPEGGQAEVSIHLYVPDNGRGAPNEHIEDYGEDGDYIDSTAVQHQAVEEALERVLEKG